MSDPSDTIITTEDDVASNDDAYDNVIPHPNAMETVASGEQVKVCWVVSNGLKGTQNQALGLAEALAKLMPLEISVKKIAIKAPWGYIPGALWPDPFKLLSTKGHLLRAPFPDIFISVGRETVPISIAMKKHSPQTFTVQTQNPHAPSHLFDMVVPPVHDGVQGDNVFSILGAPSRISVEHVERLSKEIAPRFDQLPDLRVVVLIGGSNKYLKMTTAVCDTIIGCLIELREQGYGLILSLIHI